MKSKRGIAVERVFAAPREEVWRAWTTPEIIKQWWGPEGFYAPSIKVDLKVGGQYIYAMHGPAGSQWDRDMYSGGVFEEIIPNRKLVATDYFADANGKMVDPAEYGMDPDFPGELTATVYFEETPAGGTLLSIIYEEPSAEQAEAVLKSGMEDGWQSSLNKLESYLTGKPLKSAAADMAAADDCEEKKLMDKVMDDPYREFAGTERVCDKDVENVLWKQHEPSAEEEKSLSGKKIPSAGAEKSIAADLAKEGGIPGAEDIAAHSASL